MEEAPVTAATGALGPVVARLSTLLRRDGEYKLRRGTGKDLKRIRSKLKSMHSILCVIWEVDVDAEGKKLRMESWRLADDMNDAIDDFILSLKRSNDGRRFIQAKHLPSPFKDLKTTADDVSERCRKKWKMKTPTTLSSLFSTTKTTVDESGPGKRHRVHDPYVRKGISELVGMERPRDKLIRHLVGEEETKLQLKMACILGAAGMGKTTLARLVYEAIEDKFDARAFVSVISCRTMAEVLASIYQQVQGLADSSTVVPLAGTKAATAEEHLIDDISNFLKDKRYLVIIDDIWHCGEWTTIKKSLPDNNLGSRIVTTSRYNTITEKWRDDFDALVYKIKWRDDFDALVYKINLRDYQMKTDVGEGFDHNHHIVRMCYGMPLAVACMMSALAKERERREQGLCVPGTPALQDKIWEQVMRNGIQKTPGFQPVVKSLELGYKDLPHHMLKTCLLYCSIYPERHGFGRDDMARRWIAEGFVCTEELGKDYFDELVSRGFLKQLQWIDGSCSYELHPMMRNYLRWKLREDNFITCTSDSDISSAPVSWLCIGDWSSSNAVNCLSGIDWRHIRSLVIFEDAERVPYKDLEHLRVLDVHYGYRVLENQHLTDICRLLHLRHLLLFGRISEMPADIGMLKYLESLEVTGTEITRLPAEIGDLKQLKTLDVSGNQELVELPREMGNLQHLLERLCISGANIREQAWEIIGALKKLKTLDVSNNPELSGIPRDIGELQQLKNLDVSENKGITELPKEIGKLQYLERLNLTKTSLTELPHEIGNLQRLVYLDLSDTAIKTVPRDIGKLQHLEYLDLCGTEVKKMPREIGGLQNLKYLQVELDILPFEAGQLSKLQKLPVCVRQAWKNNHLVSSLAGETLSFSSSPHWVALMNHTKHMDIPQWIKEHFNHVIHLDVRICKLDERDLKILREMPILEILKLRFEGVSRKPIAISGGGFVDLKVLTVDCRVPRITFQEGAMPRLETLVFEFQFYGGPPNTDPMDIKHLVRLGRVDFQCNKWYRGDSPCISATIDVVRKEAWEHPNKWIKVSLKVGDQERVFFQRPDVAESSHQGSNEACSSGAEEIEGT